MRLIVLLLIGLLGAGCDRQKAAPEQAAGASQPAKGVDRSHRGEAAPTVGFRTPDDGDIDFAAFRGRPLLVNLWASWCAPCVKELPTLDRLAARNGGLEVIAVSQDMAPQGSVTAFLDRLGMEAIGAYHDPEMALSGALGAQILPTTILFDSQGRELWRYVGDLDWTGEEAAKLLAEAR